MEFVIVLVVLAVVVLVITGPLRKAYRPSGSDAAAMAQLDELEAAREAKYREIRDAELDHRTGKLSDADYEAIERTLRAEAVEIMHALDRARGDRLAGAD
jgi:Tfp pilus assembly protein PilE